MKEKEKNRIVGDALIVADVIRDFGRGGYLPHPCIDGTTEAYPDFLTDADHNDFQFLLKRKGMQRREFLQYLRAPLRYGLLEEMPSDASIGGTGFREISIPADFNERIEKFTNTGNRKKRYFDNMQPSLF